MLKPVTLANVDPSSLKQFENGSGSHNAYLGIIDTGSSRFSAYIKETPDYELAREIVSAQLGQALGLPTLEPIMVNFRRIEKNEYGFATAFQNGSSNFSQFAKSNPNMLEQIQKWSSIRECICFDEWIANPDRTLDNILVTGRNKYKLIDHGESFPSEMQAETKFSNGLARIAISGVPRNELEIACSKTLASCSRFSSIDFYALREYSHVENWNGNSFIDGCIQILEDRMSFLPQLLEQEFLSSQGHLQYSIDKKKLH